MCLIWASEALRHVALDPKCYITRGATPCKPPHRDTPDLPIEWQYPKTRGEIPLPASSTSSSLYRGLLVLHVAFWAFVLVFWAFILAFCFWAFILAFGASFGSFGPLFWPCGPSFWPSGLSFWPSGLLGLHFGLLGLHFGRLGLYSGLLALVWLECHGRWEFTGLP